MKQSSIFLKLKSSGNMLRGCFLFILIAFASSVVLQSCSKNDRIEDDIDIPQGFEITSISIPPTIDQLVGSDVTIIGRGFAEGDEIVLTPKDGNGQQYVSPLKSVALLSATFTLPDGIISGTYDMAVRRNGETFPLGSVVLNVTIDIPDQEGMNIKGVVHHNGVGIAGVVVSDGVEVTKTNEEGIYYLHSEKKNGYVFVSIPGNYEVENEGNYPQFFKRIPATSTTFRADFALTPVNNTKHVLLAMADFHLANRNNDIAQFRNGFLRDANAVIDAYKNSGTKVYGLTLGDLTWETYWYSNNYALAQYLTEMNGINCPVFNTMGNHDHDPYFADDWFSEERYRQIVGPNYYSFNLGDVHYIVLDNTEYINTGGAQGTMGDRSYNGVIASEQIEWLKKDLETIQDKETPIVIAMHIQLHHNPTLTAGGQQTSTMRLSNAAEFTNILSSFSNVNVLTGHLHYNFRAENESGTLTEHNNAAVCATWWWTGRNGYAGNHICKDGSPGGYGVWEIDGRDMEWYYKSIGYERDYQFRTYDLNSVHITPEVYAPNANPEFQAKLSEYADEYAVSNNDNEVLINVWGYDTRWTIEVTENGIPLDVQRIRGLDPLHIISYSALRLNVNANPTASFVSSQTAHLFKVTASNATSTLDVKVVDRFGNTYTERMERPKQFHYSMR